MTDEIPRRLEARRGYSVSYRGKTLLSLIDPAAQAERAVRAARIFSRTLYFCPSPLYGYGLDLLLRTMTADSALLCVESDPNLMAFSREALDPLLAGHPAARLAHSASAPEICAFVRREWGARRFRRLEVLRTGAAWQLHDELYAAMAAALEQDLARDWSNAMTLARLGRRFALNMVRNLHLLALAGDSARLAYGGAPLLVLGAGPSLDGALAALAGLTAGYADPATRPFRLLCVDTALSALRERNIRPDLVVALESQHWNLRDFIGAGGTGIPVAMDLSSLPATARAMGGPAYLFFTPWTPLRIFDRLRQADLLPAALAPLGSVGLTAVALALAAGSGPVVVAGLDFAYGPDAYHARSTPGHRDRLIRADRLGGLIDVGPAFRAGTRAAVGKGGAALRSDPVLSGYRDLFEREFGASARLFDLGTAGLPLGITRVDGPEAAGILTAPVAAPDGAAAAAAAQPGAPERIRRAGAFIRDERRRLADLRDLLSGARRDGADRLEQLLNDADYLWAHFPEYAATEAPRRTADLSFLKRVRAELDPFIKAFDLCLADLDRG